MSPSDAIPLPTRRRAVPSGTLLLVVSAIAFSTAGFFAREAAVDPWTMVVWRNLFGALALLPLMLRPGAPPWRRAPMLTANGLAIVVVSAVATVLFLAALSFTTVANVAIIYATAPLTTAGLARVWLGEPVSRKTLAGAALALSGVGVTVAGSVGGGTRPGDALAVGMTLGMSVMTVLARRGPSLPPLPAACGSALLAAAIALPIAAVQGASIVIAWPAVGWLAAFGATTMALALPCYLVGTRSVPAARAMLLSTLEMPLAPLWVWLAFGETPSMAPWPAAPSLPSPSPCNCWKDDEPRANGIHMIKSMFEKDVVLFSLRMHWLHFR